MDVLAIVTNLLRLSSEASQPRELLTSALAEIRAQTGAGLAVVSASPPDWTTLSSQGIATKVLPMELAAAALDRESTVVADGWIAVPLRAERPSSTVLLVHGKIDRQTVEQLAAPLADALAMVNRAGGAARRIRRLEKVLDITHEWHQTNEMEVLLTRMAEAATELLAADRASIFLWDKPNKTLVGRPALGMEGGELRLADDAGVVGEVVQTGQPRRIDSQAADTAIDRSVDEKTGYRTETILCVPLVTPAGHRLGAFEVLNKQDGDFTPDDERGLLELAAYASVALENTQHLEGLLQRHEQLVEQAAQGVTLVGDCPPIEALRKTIARVADTDLAILILGENGTGKEVVARAMHYRSRRRQEPFIAVNCAALTETLLESELFGHEKGAFTDAHESRAGKFELASGGTLFLDEIGDMSLGGQAKLLRVLEEKTVVRVGGSTPIHTEIRVLAATNQDLAEMVRAKKFREDLYFRLNVVTLELPALRDRGDDVLLLADHFLGEFCRQAGRKKPKFSATARKRLLSHRWPGNVRELRNLMERLAYLTSGDKIEADDLAFIMPPGTDNAALLDGNLSLNEATRQFQQDYIRHTIERARGNVTEAAEVLGLHRSNLYRKMHQLGMSDEDAE